MCHLLVSLAKITKFSICHFERQFINTTIMPMLQENRFVLILNSNMSVVNYLIVLGIVCGTLNRTEAEFYRNPNLGHAEANGRKWPSVSLPPP